MTTHRIGIRRRLFLVVLLPVAAALALLVLGFNVLLDRTLDRDARNLARTRAAAQVALVHWSHGRLAVAESPDDAAGDSYIWVFSAGRTLEQPRVGPVVNDAARSLIRGPTRFADVNQADVRLYAAPVVVDGRRIGTVVAGVSLAPYEQTRRAALIASLVLGPLVLVLVAFVARWLLNAALRPVHRMTTQAAAWSELEQPDGRFGMGEPYDELTELATTLDGLLARLAASLRHEQRFSAEISHELRTPLARILAESELALRRERSSVEYRASLELVHRNAAQLTRIVDALVTAFRHQAGAGRGTADAYGVAEAGLAACAALASDREIELDVAQPVRPVRVGVELELAERILEPVLENACRYGARQVRVNIERSSKAVRYIVEDDGPGVDEREVDTIFDPGVRGRRGLESGIAGAGLGLALARRLARGVDGEVEAVAAAAGGRFLVTLPAG
jgi:two-component system, OmpR family, sensor kinase